MTKPQSVPYKFNVTSDILGIFTVASSTQRPANSTLSRSVIEYLAKVTSSILTLAEDLAVQGFPRVLVMNIPLLSSLPLFGGQDFADVRGGLDVAVETVNEGISKGVDQLSSAYPSVHFLAVDLHKLLTDVRLTRGSSISGKSVAAISKPFQNTTSACLVSSPPSNLFRLNSVLVSVCSNPDGYFFWDAIHPTARGHALIADAVESVLASAGIL